MAFPIEVGSAWSSIACQPHPEGGRPRPQRYGALHLHRRGRHATRADYTFAYRKLDGRVLISLYHSSLTWLLPLED